MTVPLDPLGLEAAADSLTPAARALNWYPEWREEQAAFVVTAYLRAKARGEDLPKKRRRR